MSFQWPEALWLLAALPLLVAAYFYALRRRKKVAVRYASLSLVRQAAGKQGIRRHIPPLLLLAALAVMILAVARPQAVLTLPSPHETVILAMDVSGSMRATDIKPTRLAAAQAAAKSFIAAQPDSTRIGIVAFAGSATLAQAPTHNREELVAAIERFQLQRATAIGSAIIVSLATLFPEDGLDVATFTYGERQAGGAKPPAQPKVPAQSKPPAKPVAPGSYESALIILLTDGQRTTGPDSLKAAKLAAERGVRIYTVGVGTPEGEIVGIEGWSMRVSLDEKTLKSIAHETRGEYFHAANAEELNDVYERLQSRIVLETKNLEVTALFAAAAALLTLLAALLSLAWFSRIL